MKWPWDKDDHEKIEDRLDELEESAQDAAVRLRRIELELGIYKPEITVVPAEKDAA